MAERMADARSSIFNDQHVQGLINEFSAVVIEDSIQPVGNVVK